MIGGLGLDLFQYVSCVNTEILYLQHLLPRMLISTLHTLRVAFRCFLKKNTNSSENTCILIGEVRGTNLRRASLLISGEEAAFSPKELPRKQGCFADF